MYYLSKFDDVIKSCFWVIPKIASANLWKRIHDIINCSISPFKYGKCEMEGKNNKTEIFWEQKERSTWNEEAFFIVSEGLSFGKKIQNSGYKL